MLRDAGSRDPEFIQAVARVLDGLLTVAGVPREGWAAIPVQGSGTYAIEAVISSAIPPDGTLLALVNGAYGERMAEIAERHRIPVERLPYPENETPQPTDVQNALESDSRITMVAAVHCETTTGIVNPVEEIGRVVAQAGRTYFVDAMSSFAAIPLDLETAGVDYLTSSSNKCLEGVPGLGFVIARRSPLEASDGWARTVALDLLAQLRGIEGNGQFRFTPPTHVILALDQALRELADEGGVAGRAQRYAANHRVLVAGMRELGFRELLPPERQSYIITSFHYPDDPAFDFERFYRLLSDRGLIIYPGRVTQADCFRIGTIGRIFPSDVERLLAGIREVLAVMRIATPAASL
jgi:2-aminoethylphosphonate-pyruvate transaminase